jgi:tRNA nucleotidyltransferase (CCA-adding enzyme)
MPRSLPTSLARASFPRPLLRVLETLGAAGHRSWLVGGAVRDLLLRRPHADADVATPATPQEVTDLFRRAGARVVPTGVEHGTVTVVLGGQQIEVTTFRGEGEYRDGRRPSSVKFHGDLDADLARRDLTMNAMAFDPLARELRDPFGGRADLAARTIRAVGAPAARFAEDGLRPLRAVRFAAQLGFELEPATHDAIPTALPVTARVAAERVSDELTKLLLAPHALRGLRLLDSTGLLSVVLPDVAELTEDLRDHAAAVAAAAPAELAIRLAGLLHVLSVEDAPGPAAARARTVLARLRFPVRVAEEASALIDLHGCLLAGPAEVLATPVGARRWLARAGAARAPALLAFWRADARSLPAEQVPDAVAAHRRAASRVRRTLREAPPLAIGDLALDGRSVMEVAAIPPGRQVGEALRHLLDLVLEDPARNTRPALEDAVRRWHATPGTGTR